MVVGDLASLVGDQRLVVSWRLGFDLASLGLGVSRVMAVDLSTDPVVREFFAEISKDSDASEEVKEFMQNKVALPIPIITTCALFTGSKVNLRHRPAPVRDVLRDAYFIAAI